MWGVYCVDDSHQLLLYPYCDLRKVWRLAVASVLAHPHLSERRKCNRTLMLPLLLAKTK